MSKRKSIKPVKKRFKKSKACEELSPDDLIVLAKKDFLVFVELMFPILHPGIELVHAPYIELIVECLMVLPDLEKPRLIFNLPPGYMKSTIISILFTAWKLGEDPTWRFICISYGDDLAHELSERTRKVMQSEVYGKIFPNTILEKKAQDHLKTTKGGARYATAVGSDIAGFRANTVIIDDGIQPEDAESERVKIALQNWFYSSVLTRLIDQRSDSVVLVMHRLSPNDLSGVLEQLGWTTIKLPLIAETDSEYIINDKLLWERKTGELLNPNRMTTEDVGKLRMEIPPHVFEAQYQQRPTSSGSGLFAIDRVARYHKPPPFELIIHSWDVAGTLTGNFSVCTQFGLCKDPKLGDVLYVIGVIRIKLLLPDVPDFIEMVMKRDGATMTVIDSDGLGLGIVTSLQRKYGAFKVKESHDILSKIARYGFAMQYTYHSKVYLPYAAPWLEPWLYEMIAFPNSDYDDQVDSFTQVVSDFEEVIMFARQARDRAGRGY